MAYMNRVVKVKKHDLKLSKHGMPDEQRRSVLSTGVNSVGGTVVPLLRTVPASARQTKADVQFRKAAR